LRMGLSFRRGFRQGALRLPEAEQKRASDRYHSPGRWRIPFLFSSGYITEERLAY